MNTNLLVGLLVSVFCSTVGEDNLWTYDYNDFYGPRRWGALNPECNGNRQSPIVIDTKTASRSNLGPPLILGGIHLRPNSVTFSNEKKSCNFFIHFK